MAHQASKLYKFRKSSTGSPATVLDFKKAAAEIRVQVNNLMADTKAVRAFMPKEAKEQKMISILLADNLAVHDHL